MSDTNSARSNDAAARYQVPNRHPPFRLHVKIVAVAASLSACVISACVHANERAYLTGSEIERLIIGKGLKDARADQWKETFLPGETGAKEGTIWSHSRVAPPYTGTWSMEADRICVEYPSDEGGCYRLSMEQANRVLWFDGAGALAFESTLVEADRPEVVAPASMGLPFRRETVTFRHGENTLVGDLSLPTEPPPHPAILFVEARARRVVMVPARSRMSSFAGASRP